jgi:MerR HTH family regulatory protein
MSPKQYRRQSPRPIAAPTVTAPSMTSVMQPEPLLHTRQQASRLLNCSITTLQRLEKAGVLKPVKLNKPSGQTFYRHHDLVVLATGR